MKKGVMNKKINQTSLFIQIILLVILVYFLTLVIFIPNFKNLVDYLLSFTLIVMAYNNYKIYKRKNMTLLYSIVGSLLLVMSIIESIHG